MTTAYSVDTVALGKKGQITLPKHIRDEDGLSEDDSFVVTHLPGGEIVLRPVRNDAPEDKMLAIVSTVKPFDWRKTWEEVRQERRRDR